MTGHCGDGRCSEEICNCACLACMTPAERTPEPLSVADAIAVVLATLNGEPYGLTTESQLEALGMACRELETSNVEEAVEASRKALSAMLADLSPERGLSPVLAKHFGTSKARAELALALLGGAS